MSYPVLDPVSQAYPRVRGRLLTCYSPVRRSSTPKGLSARLACVKHAASVRPEPGSNSPKESENPADTTPQEMAPNQRNHPKDEKTIGTGITSTLLSSQRTSTHQTTIPHSRPSLGQLAYL